jgi:hypothetical protein
LAHQYRHWNTGLLHIQQRDGFRRQPHYVPREFEVARCRRTPLLGAIKAAYQSSPR